MQEDTRRVDLLDLSSTWRGRLPVTMSNHPKSATRRRGWILLATIGPWPPGETAPMILLLALGRLANA
jgi:hypothetical protein